MFDNCWSMLYRAVILDLAFQAEQGVGECISREAVSVYVRVLPRVSMSSI